MWPDGGYNNSPCLVPCFRTVSVNQHPVILFSVHQFIMSAMTTDMAVFHHVHLVTVLQVLQNRTNTAALHRLITHFISCNKKHNYYKVTLVLLYKTSEAYIKSASLLPTLSNWIIIHFNMYIYLVSYAQNAQQNTYRTPSDVCLPYHCHWCQCQCHHCHHHRCCFVIIDFFYN